MEKCHVYSIFQMLDSGYPISSNTATNQCELLQKLINFYSILDHRQAVTKQHWMTLFKLLSHAETIIAKKDDISHGEWNFLTNVYRCLRNCSAGCYRDDHFMSTEELINTAVASLLPQISRQRVDEIETVTLRCGLQMLGNIATQSDKTKEIVWKKFFDKGIFISLLKDCDEKVIEITMMILHACLTVASRQKELLTTADGMALLMCILHTLSENVIDWGVMLLESVMDNQSFMGVYDILPIENRLLCLDILAERLDNNRDLNETALKITLESLKQHFVEDVMDIMKICESSAGDLKSVEITKLLSILCSASVAPSTQLHLQSYSDLLETSVDVLKSVHLLGKKSTNAFSSISTLRDREDTSEEDINSHPSFCFKKNLIRIIGNMCYQHKRNQDSVRDLDGIPLLMDCCNLDVRNPYIMQWCIFAIRNVLENNAENQAAMAGISLTAEMADSPLLKELGLTVELENGHPVLKKPSSKSL